MRWVVLLAVLSASRAAHAFCGFYVAGAEDDLFNNATTVAMMRDGTRTVLSMQNNYQGPPEDFAMVVPVPVVLQKKNVKTLPPEIFDRLDKLAAPRLVEYWEQDPCPPDGGYGTIGIGKYASIGAGGGTGSGYGRGVERPKVVVEAQFKVGEYEIVILSAEEATALQDWLTGNGYKIPAGAAKYLEPYVANGMKFFVAKVDIEKVKMKDGMATLSPLRFHYDTEKFELPIRLGLINSNGTQDLIVHIVAPGTRYEVANYENVTIPTNLIVQNEVRERFGEFYAALFDATLEKNPGAVVTEYAWSASTCDPCPDTPLSDSELLTLGLDVLYGDGNGKTPVLEPVLRMGNLTVKGKMDKNIVRRYVRRSYPRLRACPTTSRRGSFILNFNITDEGDLTDVKVTGTKDTKLAACIQGAVAPMKLPSKLASRVKYQFNYTTRPVGRGLGGGFVLTRLHARYDKDALGDDLVFKKADPIVGGTGGATPEDSDLGTGGFASGRIGTIGRGTGSMSMFQGRYIIRHEWEGKIECEKPQRGMWGGPPAGPSTGSGQAGSAAPQAAQNLAFAKRGAVTLTSMLAQPVPDLAVDKGEPVAEDTDDSKQPAKPEPPETEKKGGGGCGCRTGGAPGGAPWAALLLIALARGGRGKRPWRRRARRARPDRARRRRRGLRPRRRWAAR